MDKPYISVVIPVYNEDENLEKLFDRLMPVMESLHKTYEIIFINDGSHDNSIYILEKLFHKYPSIIRVIDFTGNFGQHMAVMAGFQYTKGEIIVTLDADLQNPPEEIPKLIAGMEQGYDLVSGVRQSRKDNHFRRYASKISNRIRAKITKVNLSDQGCMLRAYSRNIINLLVASTERSIYIPALAYLYADKPTEVTVQHDERLAGKSKYNILTLIRQNFDLMTGYSLIPLQTFTLLGFIISILSFLFGIYMFIRRLIIGPEVQGVFTLFAILFFLIGLLLMGLGITGEYIGRIYQEVRNRPRFAIKKILEKSS